MICDDAGAYAEIRTNEASGESLGGDTCLEFEASSIRSRRKESIQSHESDSHITRIQVDQILRLVGRAARNGAQKVLK